MIAGDAFGAKLTAREAELWSKAGARGHDAQTCEHQLVTRHDADSLWKCCPFWQRKLSHKLTAKEYAIRCGVRTAGLLWCGSDPGEIPFASLPRCYTVKLTNGAGCKQVMPLCDLRDMLRNEALSTDVIVARLRQMLVAVDDPDNLVLVEEYLGHPVLGLPNDYKFFCFHGSAQVVYECDRNVGTLTWFDREWNAIDDPMHTARPSGLKGFAPAILPQLLATAEHLARAYEYPFVRIDLYNCANQPVFGEFTHTPLADELSGFTEFSNRVLGMLWDQPGLDFKTAARRARVL
jgi:TupA-like ATPgrasp